jgi:hypothetical protein
VYGFRLWYRFGFGAPGNVLEVEVGTVKVDVPRSVGYFGGLSVAVGLIEPPLALFIASEPVFEPWTNTGLPKAVRVVGELLEGAAKPVGSDAEGVIQLQDQQLSATKVVNLALKATRRSATAKTK